MGASSCRILLWAIVVRGDANKRMGRCAPGILMRTDASGDARANLGGLPAQRPPGDRHRHGWCRKTLNGKVTKFHFMPIKMRMQGGGLHAQ